MKYILRVLTLPLFVGLLFIALVRDLIKQSGLWVLYGGEVLVYNQKTKDTIKELLKKYEDEAD